MLVKTLPEIENALSICRLNFNIYKNSNEHLNKQIDIYQSITDWRYSDGAFFFPLPFRTERDGYNTRLLKKKYLNPDEASEKGMYSAGFINDKHVVTRQPVAAAVNVLSLETFEYDANTIKMLVANHYINKAANKPPSLRGTGFLHLSSDANMYYAGVGDGDAFHVVCLEYSNGKLVKETADAQGWNGQVEFFYEYHENGDLMRIRTPSKDPNFDVKIWPKSKDWKIPNLLS